jgi:ABC-type transport system substrate-binding protein
MSSGNPVTRRRFLKRTLAAAAVGGITLVGCGGGDKEVAEQSPRATGGEPKQGGQRERGTPGGFNIDPRLNYVAGPIVGSACYSYLWTVRTDTDELIPVAATSIEQVDDLTYLFKINENIRFHDTAIFPGLAISLTVLSFNLLGDSLRDLLDPRLRGR